MKRFVLLVTLVLITISSVGQTADKLMSDAVAKFSQAGSVDISFTATNGQSRISGDLIMQNTSYRLTTSGMSIWYDGNTQWVYSSKSDEITITVPDNDALMESNPVTLMHSYKQLYTLTKGAGRSVILTPRSKTHNGFDRAVISFGTDGWPEKIDALMDNGTSVSFTITSVKTAPAKPAAEFRLDVKKYPSAEIVDLR